MKNVLAVVQSLVMRTLADHRSMEEARNILSERLLALSRAHDVLMHSDWKGAPIRDIIAAEIAPFGTRVALEDRISSSMAGWYRPSRSWCTN